ncbi:WbuC family cupin fold metalloprotein [Stagnimonas aquatica]|uniref:WbuC family cupin fold metalloprotein n=1 Tax=Stagnimonas aquatica TaxID=2689987 RepID=UPI00131558F6|nr:WbuC family cupin fold metalloprotein [Stagnimonas aquatica]
MTRRLGPAELAALRAAAEASPRRRAHLELHAGGADDALQRFLVGMLPGSYVRAHRHVQAHKLELTACLAGAFELLLFDDRGALLERQGLAVDGNGLCLVQIPPNTWHSLIVREGFAVLLEVKLGPYEAASDKDFAPWAPVEGSAEADHCLRWLHGAVAGQRYLA